MKRFPKFLVGELDGNELDASTEYEAFSHDIYYDDIKSETSKDAIDSFKYKLSDNFIIPINRSKIITGELEINGFYLEVEGILEIA